MPSTAVLGLQWGDEGKGKVVDLLAADADYAVRFNGGDNAGHAVKVDGRRVGLRLVPSSIFHPRVVKVLAAGMVINPQTLLDEVEALEAEGFPLDDLVVSDRAHLVLPWHLRADRAAGASTTGRGIGPAYAAKAGRLGALRVCDLPSAGLERRLGEIGGRPAELGAVAAVLRRFQRRFRRCTKDTTRLLNDALDRGDRVLLEGAQGALLDVDHGTYPHVTASSTVAGGACTGAGLAPSRIDRVVGVVKAYVTRVGSGPFPTEASAAEADVLRKRGAELGTATGLLRRCGWLDLVALRHAVMLDRPGELALTKLDVVEPLGRVPVCLEYRLGRRSLDALPSAGLDRVRPVYERVAPERLADFLEDQLETRVSIVSVGAERGETRVRRRQ